MLETSRSHLGAWLSRASIRDTLTLGAGTVIGQVLVIGVTPVLTRLYLPADMAVFGLFLAFLGPATVVATLRYDMAIVLGSTEEEANLLLLLCLVFLIPTSFLSSCAMWGMVVFDLAAFADLPKWSPLVMFPLLVATGVFVTLRYWHTRTRDFRLVSIGLIEQGAGRAFVPLILGLFVGGWYGLLAGEGAGRLLGVRPLLLNARPALVGAFRGFDRPAATKTLRRYIQFPLLVLPSALLDAVTAIASTPIVTSFYGLQLAGQFFLAHRIVLAPAALLASSIADVYHTRFVEASRADPRATRDVLVRGLWKLGGICTVVYAPVAIAAPVFGRAVFGQEWGEVGIIISALTPAALAGSIVNPLSRALTVSRVLYLKFVVDVVRLILPIGAIIGGSWFGATLLQASIAFSIATVIGNAFYLATVWYCVSPDLQRDLS